MRFDMRAPDFGAPIQELYAAALEMAEWGESRGCMSIQLSEHHASSDGYLPAPFLLASGMAARTTRLPLQIAALLVPLHDPVALAAAAGLAPRSTLKAEGRLTLNAKNRKGLPPIG